MLLLTRGPPLHQATMALVGADLCVGPFPLKKTCLENRQVLLYINGANTRKMLR